MVFSPSFHKYKLCGTGVSIPVFLICTLLIFFFYTMASDTPHSVPVPGSPARDFHFEYTVQKGFFLQSEDSTDDTVFDFKKQNFGLINRNYPSSSQAASETQWSRFTTHLDSLTRSAKPTTHYKLLFLGRHGQGWHNVAEAKYGTRAWDCYYAQLRGHDGLVWADAQLTPQGQQQARDVHALWDAQLRRGGIPAPRTYYVSPLTRALETADLSFGNLTLPRGREYRQLVKELLREALGVHTCDQRSSRSHIENAFPHVAFEDGFVDADPLWEADYREPESARRYRLASLLDDVFASDEGVVLSFTSHSGAIASLLGAVGHRPFKLETGGVIPVFLKAERVEGKREVPPKEPSEAPPMCDGPPDAEGDHVSVD